MALEAVQARLARDGRRVLCGRVRPGVSPCGPDLGVYFGRDGSDPLAWRFEFLGKVNPVAGGHDGLRLFAAAEWRLKAEKRGLPPTRGAATRYPEPFHFEGMGELEDAYRGGARRWDIRFTDEPAILVRCSACGTVNRVAGADLVRQYGELVERGRLATSR